MYHPLLGNPSDLKDQELELKIIDLSKKYQIAASMGQGSVCQQIIAALEMYKEDMSRRQRETMASLLKKQDRGLDDLINVE
jgi:hypothetical protein